METLKNYKDTIILILSMLIGGLIGYVWGPGAQVVQPIADIYLNLLFVIIVPLIFISLVNSISSMSDMKKLGKIILIMFLVFFVVQFISTFIMGGASLVFKPASGVEPVITGEDVVLEESNFNFLSQLTVSDFPELFSRNNLMALVVFSLLTGFSLAAIKDKVPHLVQVVSDLNDLVMKIVGMIMSLTPIGIFFFFMSTIGQYGADMSGPMVRTVTFTFILTIFYFAIMNTIYAGVAGGKDGIRSFWSHVWTPALTALGTASSAASIPAALTAAKRIGVKDEVADLSIPIGTNMHKAGATFVIASTAAYILPQFGINFDSPENFLKAMFITIISASITGAIPNGGNVSTLLIVSAFGLPSAAVPIMIVYNTLVDAPTTAMNVSSNVVCSMITDRFVNKRKVGSVDNTESSI